MSKNKTIIFIIVLILVSSLFRFWKLGNQSLWIDEGFTINASLSIIERGIPILGSDKIYNNGNLYNYITAGSIKLFGLDPFSPWQTRLPSALFGVFSVVLIYLLSLKLFNQNVALLSSVIMSFSAWQIAWSRQTRGYTAVQFFIILSFYFLLIWLKNKKNRYLFLFLISFIFSALSHNIAVIFLPSFIVIALLYPKKKLSIKQWIFLLFIFSFIIIFFLAVIKFPETSFYNFFSYYIRFIQNEFLIFILISIAGLLLGIFDKNRYSSFSLFIIIIFPFIIISSFIYMIHYRYLFPIFPFIIILFSYGITKFFEIIQKITKTKSYIFTILPSFILTILLIFPHLNFLPKETYLLEYGSPQPNFKEGYKIIKELKKDSDIIISPYTPLNKIYLNDIGFWLPISLSGKENELENIIYEERDYYTGAPAIINNNSLLKIINEESGFIVVDQMAKNRLGQTFNLINNHEKTKIIFEEKAPKLGNLWIYKF